MRALASTSTLLACLALAACGGGEDEPAPAAPTRESVDAAAAEAERELYADSADGEISAETAAQAAAAEAEGPTNLDLPAEQPNPLYFARTPRGAIKEWVTYYSNWSTKTIAERRRSLIDRSVGRAQQQVRREAEQLEADYELRGARSANRGYIEALVDQGAGRYLVVVREVGTSARQRSPATSIVFHARVREVDGRWAVSSWTPN